MGFNSGFKGLRMRVTYRCEYLISEGVDSVVLPALIAHHTPTSIHHAMALRGLSMYF